MGESTLFGNCVSFQKSFCTNFLFKSVTALPWLSICFHMTLRTPSSRCRIPNVVEKKHFLTANTRFCRDFQRSSTLCLKIFGLVNSPAVLVICRVFCYTQISSSKC